MINILLMMTFGSFIWGRIVNCKSIFQTSEKHEKRVDWKIIVPRMISLNSDKMSLVLSALAHIMSNQPCRITDHRYHYRLSINTNIYQTSLRKCTRENNVNNAGYAIWNSTDSIIRISSVLVVLIRMIKSVEFQIA